MLLILLHLVFSYILFWTAGCCVLMPFASPSGRRILPVDPVLLPLTGYLLYIPLLSLISLFAPLELTLLMVLFFLQLFLIILFHRRMTAFGRNFLPSGWQAAAVLLMLPYAAVTPTLPDMWGYHAQAMQWSWYYAAVPGLANLSSKLAFNFASFLPAGLLSFRNIADPPFLSLNPFLWSLVLLAFTGQAARGLSWIRQCLLSLLFVLVCHYYLAQLSSSSVESTSAALILLLFLLLVLEKPADGAAVPLHRMLIIALCLILPVIKLSNFVFLFPAIPLTMQLPKRYRKWPLILCFFVYLPWLARNFILSGYLVYPFPFIDLLSPDWKIPRETALADFNWIRSWSRLAWEPADRVLDLPWSVWVPAWFRQVGLFTRTFLLSGFLTLILFLFHRTWQKAIPAALRWFGAALAGSLAWWFFMAPDPRFIIPVLVLFTLLPWWYHPGSWLSGFRRLNAGFLQDRLPLVIITLFFALSLFFLQPPGKVAWMKPAPFPSVTMTGARAGPFTIHLPYRDVNSYDYPIPCAPHLNAGLEARGMSLKNGFRTAGPTSNPNTP